MPIACWVPKATTTLSQYVTITAVPLHQWLQERGSMLRYAHIACLVCYASFSAAEEFKSRLNIFRKTRKFI
jgi:hypothetical protein